MDKASVSEAEDCGFESRRGYGAVTALCFLFCFCFCFCHWRVEKNGKKTRRVKRRSGSGRIQTDIYASWSALFDCDLLCLAEGPIKRQAYDVGHLPSSRKSGKSQTLGECAIKFELKFARDTHESR